MNVAACQSKGNKHCFSYLGKSGSFFCSLWYVGLVYRAKANHI